MIRSRRPRGEEYAWLGVGVFQDVCDRLARIRPWHIKDTWEARDVLTVGDGGHVPASAAVVKAALELLHADLLVQGKCVVDGPILKVTTWLFRPGVDPPETAEFAGEVAQPLRVTGEMAAYIAKASGASLREADL